MAQSLSKKLDSGDAFPRIGLTFLDGTTKSTEDLQGKWSVLLIYRGDW